MKRVPTEMPYIDPQGIYPIGQASELVLVSRETLRSDAMNGIIRFRVSERNGRKRFYGKDLIHYREYVV